MARLQRTLHAIKAQSFQETDVLEGACFYLRFLQLRTDLLNKYPIQSEKAKQIEGLRLGIGSWNFGNGIFEQRKVAGRGRHFSADFGGFNIT
ncbi:hypothetical protein B1R32_10439 [Abditibacterium utsteinense]|uniref:Uncharacterized protein n=1 Tax=Abditibacterium utsteinense TaxID=1960156 RepID=A0A2S8SUS7_9BACT|nr:hypothetical protein B1R32_10439 [Abditibacterium utsteinense]